jgi:hypothetical protein
LINHRKLTSEHLLFGVFSFLFFPLVWLSLPFAIKAVILGSQSLRVDGFNRLGFLSLFLGCTSIIFSLLVFFVILLPDIVHYGGRLNI